MVVRHVLSLARTTQSTHTLIYIEQDVFDRHKCDIEHNGEWDEDDDENPACYDCGVEPGEPHDAGCDIARCLMTGEQRLGYERDHDCGQDAWTGVWPGEAECREFGWYSKWLDADGVPMRFGERGGCSALGAVCRARKCSVATGSISGICQPASSRKTVTLPTHETTSGSTSFLSAVDRSIPPGMAIQTDARTLAPVDLRCSLRQIRLPRADDPWARAQRAVCTRCLRLLGSTSQPGCPYGQLSDCPTPDTNATQVIGFVNGFVNTALIASFCGTAEGYIRVWNDRSRPPSGQVAATSGSET
jgi:hypothetical protein